MLIKKVADLSVKLRHLESHNLSSPFVVPYIYI